MSGRRRVLAGLLLAFGTASVVELARLGAAGPPAFAGCWLLPNAAVPVLGALDPGCPLRPHERVVAVDREGGRIPVSGRGALVSLGAPAPVRAVAERRGTRREIALGAVPAAAGPLRLGAGAALASALVLGAAGLLLRGRSAADVPLAVAAAAIALQLPAALHRAPSDVLDISWVLAQAFLPASVTHLALVFPRERRVLERAKGLAALPYVAAAVLALFEWLLLERGSRLWELPDQGTTTWLVVACAGLAVSSYLAFEESSSERERAAARVLLYASTAGAGLLVVLALGVGSALPAIPRRTVTLSSALLFGALVYAVARHGSFDPPRWVRWWASYVIYTGLVASLLGAGLHAAHALGGWPVPGPDPVLLLAAVFPSLLAVDGLRRLAWGLAEAWVTPCTPRLEAQRRRAAAGLAAADSADRAAAILARALSRGLDIPRVTVFLRLGDARWRLAAVAEAAPFDAQIASAAEDVLGSARGARTARSPVLDLRGLLGQDRGALRALRVEGVRLACELSTGGQRRGLVLVGTPDRGRTISSDHAAFVEQLCLQAAGALRRAELEQELLTAARMAAVGRAAAGLAHDLGRPLGEILLLARPPTAGGGLESVHALARECLELLEDLVRGARSRSAPPGTVRLENVLEGACERIARLCGGRQPVLRLSPALPALRDAGSVQRVVENLLENAMQWSPPESPVELAASAAGGCIRLRVVDHGAGMEPEVLAQAFAPFFSRRPRDTGGSGLGLTICRDIVSSLGGDVRIRSRPGRGTTVEATFPLERSAA